MLVSGLADRGIGQRDANEHDTGLVHLRLTPKGQRQVCSWHAAHHRALLTTLPPLSNEQLATISVELELLLPALERPRKSKS